mgnify:CR=1 FL=1
MNNLLASVAGFLNGLLALTFVIGGALIGSALNYKIEGMGDWLGYNIQGMGTIYGLCTGLIIALIVCGFIAIFVSMRNELKEIRRLLQDQNHLAEI